MTVLLVVCMIIAFFLVPYLTGNVYGFVFRKKNMGIVSTYLSGMVLVYASLTVMQFVVVKFKFDFQDVILMYHILFVACVVAGGVGLALRKWKDDALKWDVMLTKKNLWVLGLILLQGILYIGCKNPYFDNNALLETTKVTMETGTIYEYSGFTLKEAVAGFPLSNKLMFFPMLYAYVSTIFGLNPALILNFVAPVVTFISFYLVMLLWVQKLGKEHTVKWELLLSLLVFVVQVGDGWSHATSFRILHSGYMGEAIFFGVIIPYGLFMIKNRCYLIALAGVAAFPGLFKYDAVIDLVKGIVQYWKEGTSYGGMLLVYVMAVICYVMIYRKLSMHLLIPNLTISHLVSFVWQKVVKQENGKWYKLRNALLVLVILLLCGNVRFVSDATEYRSNVYGAGKTEYEVLEWIEKEHPKRPVKVMACDEVGQWIRRTDFDVEPVVGYDLGEKSVQWYSYELYDENYTALWKSVNNPTPYLEEELMKLIDEIEMDYIVMERITEEVPVKDNGTLKCVYESSSYLVYFVDKN